MKIALRLLLALAVALAVSACNKNTKPDEDTTAPVAEPSKPVTTTAAAPDPRDFTDARNFDNPASLLSKRVIYFDFDRSEIKAEYRPIVAAHATFMASSSSARVSLEAHADERGTREYNLGLSERRGNAVDALLVAGGARSNQLDVVAYGEERPVCRDSTESCWQQNRRVEIVYTAR